MIVIESKLAEVLARHLGASSHADFEKGLCVMEAVSYVAGEPWSDQPKLRLPSHLCVHALLERLIAE